MSAVVASAIPIRERITKGSTVYLSADHGCAAVKVVRISQHSFTVAGRGGNFEWRHVGKRVFESIAEAIVAKEVLYAERQAEIHEDQRDLDVNMECLAAFKANQLNPGVFCKAHLRLLNRLYEYSQTTDVMRAQWLEPWSEWLSKVLIDRGLVLVRPDADRIFADVIELTCSGRAIIEDPYYWQWNEDTSLRLMDLPSDKKPEGGCDYDRLW